MKIVDPQTATLTNTEVLSYFLSNPPRKSPEGPPGLRNYEPKPDLRSHCTVVTEFHSYVKAISPHLEQYPRYTHSSVNPNSQTLQQPSTDHQQPYIQPKDLTPFENALRNTIQELLPYGLTKGEVMMLVNLGLGMNGTPKENEEGMDVDDQDEETEEEALQNYWYSDRAPLGSVIEDLPARLSDEQAYEILGIIEKNMKHWK